MTAVAGALAPCSAERPPGRRFYIHQQSFSALLAAHPDWCDDVLDALALSSMSRAVAADVEDVILFGGEPDDAVVAAETELRRCAAAHLAGVFQSLAHLAPPHQVDTLLAANEQLTAWCYEGGYFTYATDETAAETMYLESGSLRELRRRIHHDPASVPDLKMISGSNLFLLDRRMGIGPGKVVEHYRAQHRRLVTAARPCPTSVNAVVERLRRVLDTELGRVDPVARRRIDEQCVRHAAMTLQALGVRTADTTSEEQGEDRVPATAAV